MHIWSASGGNQDLQNVRIVSPHTSDGERNCLRGVSDAITAMNVSLPSRLTHGTLFHGTKIPLQKWFLAISLMANAKESLSSCQLARDLGLKQKTCWRMMMAIRTEMGKDNVLLKGIRRGRRNLYRWQG